ncbi:MAG: competence/damage-inducible protein A, partial [Pseudomonadota bacterium]|nr:competence/damage-inducible protein A [Pseudomonadota bacterium]
PEARAILEDYYADRGGVTDARLRMARVPSGAELIPNPTSGAPGVRIGNVFILAGVPHIAARMLDALTGKLAGGKPLLSVTISANAAESEVAALLSEVQDEHPGVAIGSYPFYRNAGFGADFVIRSEDQALVDACAEALRQRLMAAGFEPA